MGLCKKVAIGFLIIVFIEITSQECMPRNKNTTPFQTNKRQQRLAMYKPNTGNTLTKTVKSSDKTSKSHSKYSMNLLNKLIKEAKTRYGENTKAEIEPTSPYSKSFAPAPQPYCFKDFSTFPEVEYPMFVTDTWSPNYWNQLPSLQQKKTSEETKYEPTNYFKPSEKSIDKAIRALIKLRDKKVITKTSSKPSSDDVCPLEPPNQCSPSEQHNIHNATTGNSDESFPVAPPPTESSLCDECDRPGATTASPLPEGDTSQLPFPTLVTPEYSEQVISTATTAMPPTGISSSKVDSEDCDDSSPETGSTLNSESPASLPDKSIVSPIEKTYSAVGPNNSADALILSEVPVSSTKVLNNPTDNQAEPLMSEKEPLSPSEDLKNPSGIRTNLLEEQQSSTGEVSLASILDSPTNTINQPDTTSVASPAEESYFEDALGSNYEFATVPPDDVFFDTSPIHQNPDDTTSKLSPGDTDYILA